jgi:rhodanese-related sulfurtransferase
MSESPSTAAEMVAQARSKVRELSKEEFEQELASGDPLVLDIRDVRERWRDGAIPGAVSMPRGMLEFWADPDSEYYRSFMDRDRPTILYCAGGQRSALAAATLQQLGYSNVAHLGIGYNGWKDAGGAVEDVQRPSGGS